MSATIWRPEAKSGREEDRPVALANVAYGRGLRYGRTANEEQYHVQEVVGAL